MYQANNGDFSGDKINYGFPVRSSSKSFRANSSNVTLNNNTESVLYHKLWIFFFTMRNKSISLIRLNMQQYACNEHASLKELSPENGVSPCTNGK